MLVWLIISIAVLVILLITFIIVCIVDRTTYHDCEPIKIASGILMVIAAASIIGSAVCTSIYHEHYTKLIGEIISIRTDNSISGRFYLGSGYVSDKNYYYYYIKTDNCYRLDKCDASRTYILEDDYHVPSVYEIKEIGQMKTTYLIYVPVGTMVVSYTLN